MKVISLNVNGLRAAAKKGLFAWLSEKNADFICLQETKCQHNDREADNSLVLPNYHREYVDAEKKGYSGVAINVKKSLGFALCDTEGRFIQFEYPNFSVCSVYFPSGTSGEHRQAMKMAFLAEIETFLASINKPTILCGDYNIAHRKIDLKNWRSNQKNSGFLPEERAWMDKLFDKFSFLDAFRVVHPDAQVYTWWSFRGKAWAKNVGWRIDYQVLTPKLKNKIISAPVDRPHNFSIMRHL